MDWVYNEWKALGKNSEVKGNDEKVEDGLRRMGICRWIGEGWKKV